MMQDGKKLYLEAISRTAYDEVDRSNEKRNEKLYDEINRKFDDCKTAFLSISMQKQSNKKDLEKKRKKGTIQGYKIKIKPTRLQ